MKGERLKRKWDPFSEWQHYWQTSMSRKRNRFYSFTLHALCTAFIRSCSYFSHYSTWVLPYLWVENIYLRFFFMLGFDVGLGYIIYMKRMGSNAVHWCVKLLCPIYWTIWRCCKWHIWGWWPPLPYCFPN